VLDQWKSKTGEGYRPALYGRAKKEVGQRDLSNVKSGPGGVGGGKKEKSRSHVPVTRELNGSGDGIKFFKKKAGIGKRGRRRIGHSSSVRKK